jgi:hypothetical protein
LSDFIVKLLNFEAIDFHVKANLFYEVLIDQVNYFISFALKDLNKRSITIEQITLMLTFFK